MKKTKENAIAKTVWRHVSQCTFIILFAFIALFQSTTYYTAAAVITVHNYVTDDTFEYSKEQITYQINGKTITQAPPGLILSNGAAVGPFREVFETPLGAKSDYEEGKNSFTVSYGSHTIQMTLGNTEVIVDGIPCRMNNAPFVYSFQGSSEKHLYVPTRFVAETFEFDYIWDASTATASIQRPNIIYDGNTPVRYSGKTPNLYYNEAFVSVGYVFDDTALFAAEECFKNTGLASYAYSEGSGLILLKNGERMVRLVLDSPVAYINEDAYLLETVPRLITPQDSSKASVYIPAEFVAKALGYTVRYQMISGRLYISGTPANKPVIDSTDSNLPVDSELILPDTASYGKSLFSYKTHEQIQSYYTSLGYQVPGAVSAYSCINSDALYLKGIDSTSLKITDKADVLEITLSNYHNPFSGAVNYDPDAAYLNYFYMTGTDSLKILLIKTKELQYYTYSAPDGCVIHFTDANGMYQDYLRFTELGDSSTGASDATDIFSGVDLSEYLPEAIFTRNHFVIRLPENINYTAITDSDEYTNKRFTISIPGNHMSFLSEQDIYHTIDTLSNVQFSYKVANNTTVISFYTTKIQGYSYTVADGFLAVKIANPKEIYDKIIVLDAGHGGIDPGTLRGNVYEKAVNFNVINKYAQEYFKDSDIKVYYTRTTDTKIALQTRADFAALVEADLFISFHVNAHSNAAVNGTSVYYSKSNNNTVASGLQSSILATTVANKLSSAWGTRNKGILADRFVVVHNNSVPAVLVECGFITNNNDFAKIKDASYQKKAAKAIFDSVTEIFEKYPTKR